MFANKKIILVVFCLCLLSFLIGMQEGKSFYRKMVSEINNHGDAVGFGENEYVSNSNLSIKKDVEKTESLYDLMTVNIFPSIVIGSDGEIKFLDL